MIIKNHEYLLRGGPFSRIVGLAPRKLHVPSRSLRRRKLAWKSWSLRYWGHRRRLCWRLHPHRQGDRLARQQRSRVRRAAGSSAMCPGQERSLPSCLFGFRRGGQANVRRLCLPESEAVFVELDLPQTGSEPEFAITRIPREHNLEADHLANSVARLCQDITEVS